MKQEILQLLFALSLKLPKWIYGLHFVQDWILLILVKDIMKNNGGEVISAKILKDDKE